MFGVWCWVVGGWWLVLGIWCLGFRTCLEGPTHAEQEHLPRCSVLRVSGSIFWDPGTGIQVPGFVFCVLGPLGSNFSQHGPTTRPSRRKDCTESIYAFGSRLALQCRGSCRGDSGWGLGVLCLEDAPEGPAHAEQEHLLRKHLPRRMRRFRRRGRGWWPRPSQRGPGLITS